MDVCSGRAACRRSLARGAVRPGRTTMRSRYQLSCALLLVIAACDTPAEVTTDEDRSHIIALGSQTIDTRLAPLATDTGVTLVKFPGPVTPAQLAALQATSTVYTYLPHDTFLVRPNPGMTAGFAAQPAIPASWTGAYRPEYKIAKNATDLAMLEPDRPHTVMITVFPDAELSKVVA